MQKYCIIILCSVFVQGIWELDVLSNYVNSCCHALIICILHHPVGAPMLDFVNCFVLIVFVAIN